MTFVNMLLGVLALAIGIGFGRMARGPSLPDRAVALDLVATIVIGFTGVYAVSVDEPLLLDIALVLALIAFLGTVGYARYIEKGKTPWRKS